MKKGGAIYIMTNSLNTTLYVGVTSNLVKRIKEHKNHLHPDSFTARYNLHKLVYYEVFHNIVDAINREKQLKAGSRRKKIDLINSINPRWNDLYAEISDN
ncbi:GIY-YIG nuclease family protein [Aurantibacillus circumpalustris]|uniref:GIY-YIG nuclease family protein n=1 Tax=Aurantibacillus circumpalustris TaxID=3036359 RepID=UPI00295A7DEA|nr:GIY-YIG nuclease family protein [Aurantibacillus circumpalustris]